MASSQKDTTLETTSLIELPLEGEPSSMTPEGEWQIPRNLSVTISETFPFSISANQKLFTDEVKALMIRYNCSRHPFLAIKTDSERMPLWFCPLPYTYKLNCTLLPQDDTHCVAFLSRSIPRDLLVVLFAKYQVRINTPLLKFIVEDKEIVLWPKISEKFTPYFSGIIKTK